MIAWHAPAPIEVVSLVFGILGTIICLVPGLFTYGIPIAAIALVKSGNSGGS
jgi:hypothetical protein